MQHTVCNGTIQAIQKASWDTPGRSIKPSNSKAKSSHLRRFFLSANAVEAIDPPFSFDDFNGFFFGVMNFGWVVTVSDGPAEDDALEATVLDGPAEDAEHEVIVAATRSSSSELKKIVWTGPAWAFASRASRSF